MDKKSYRRLSRAELLELLIAESEKCEALERQLKEAQEQLSDRTLKQSKAGSIAEAALALSGVFEAAEVACAQYMENIKRLSDDQERLCAEREAESQEKAARILADATERARRMETNTRTRCESIIRLVSGDMDRFREELMRLEG